MRVLPALTVLGLAAGVALAGGPKKGSDLAVREFPDGRFKAMLGDDPKEKTQRVKSEAGPLEINSLAAKVSDNLTLSVTWTDYPDSFRDVPREKLLAAVRDGLKTKSAKLVTEKDVSAADPTPAAKEVQYDHGKYHTRTRLYLVGTRLYQVTATGKKDAVESDLAGKFLVSFEVTK
jgi:hypothetical protein